MIRNIFPRIQQLWVFLVSGWSFIHTLTSPIPRTLVFFPLTLYSPKFIFWQTPWRRTTVHKLRWIWKIWWECVGVWSILDRWLRRWIRFFFIRISFWSWVGPFQGCFISFCWGGFRLCFVRYIGRNSFRCFSDNIPIFRRVLFDCNWTPLTFLQWLIRWLCSPTTVHWT